MQEDDEEFLLGSNSSKDLSIINLDSSSSENLFFYNSSSSEPDDDLVEALAESIRARSGSMTLRSHATPAPQPVSKTRTLRSHTDSGAIPSAAPQPVSRIPKKSKK